MKPLKLKLTAFGPYKNEEVIDFTELEEQNLFVISGNTGSGKTTIFDGISFALYGTASGQDRDNYDMLRSDFADDDVHTSVELTFSLKGRIYRVLRQLGHIKQGNRSRTGEKYEFFEQVDGKEIPFVDRQIVTEIDKKIEQLIGLTQDQFKQIVMLPQGEFRKLLTSQTENKEAILRRLFKTEPYKQINEHLQEKRKELEKVFVQEKQTKDNFIQHIRATLPEREESAVFQLLAEENYNVNQIITSLDEEITFFKKQMAIDRQAYNRAYDTHHKKQTIFHQAEAVNKQFTELEQKQSLLTELITKQPLMTKKEKQLHAAERASRIIPYELYVNERRKEMNSRKNALQQAKETFNRVQQQYKNIQLIYEQEEKKASVREETNRVLDRLRQFLPTVKDINNQKQQLQQSKKVKQQTHKNVTNVGAKIKTLTEQMEKNDEQLKNNEELAVQLNPEQQKLEKMREQGKLIQGYIKLKNEQEKLKKQLNIKKQTRDNEQKRYNEKEQQWLSSQATILATHLHEGEACPVCGSIEHPQKATTKSKLVTKEELDSLRKVLNEADEAYRHIAGKELVNKHQLQEQVMQLKPYKLNMDDMEAELDELVKQGKEQSEKVKKLEKADKQVTELKEQHEAMSKQLEPLQLKEQKLNTLYQEQRVAYGSNQAVFHDRVQAVPADVRELPALEKQINQTEQLKQNLDNTWKKAQGDLQKVRETYTHAKANVKNSEKALEEAHEKQENTLKQFSEALSKANFSSEEFYREAKMVEEDQINLKNKIEQFNQQLTTLKQQVKDLSTALQDKEKLDLSSLTEELKQLKQAYEDALNKLNRSQEYFQEARRLQKNITEANERVRKEEKKLGVMIDLYDTVRGQNSLKISFERYLQIDYLEQIIDAANHRLKDLSNGQFMLMRSDRQESHGRQSGLALDVYDGYTGQTRDVKTLSGGEKFNASLCLALGMSDVIQSFQGNISINTMFIDEGFGSLDQESLNKSIDTLIELQESGRMIGIISHVEELKTVFPAVLEVTKTKAGYSKTEFLIK